TRSTPLSASTPPMPSKFAPPKGLPRRLLRLERLTEILERLYPPQKAITDAALVSSMTRIPDGLAKDYRLRFGQEVAEKMFELRKDEGASAEVPYNSGTGPGVYQPTPPMNANPILPQWRNVKPFSIMSAKQFAFSGPPAATSAAFAKDFDEVK